MARNFTVLNDAIQYPSDTALNLTGPLSITGWVYLNSASKFHMILCKGTGTTINISYELRTTNETPAPRLVTIRANATQTSGQITSTAGLTTGAWHHIGMTWETTGNPDIVKYYIDGVLDSSVSAGNLNYTATTGTAIIGNRFDFANTQDKRLAHVCLYNKALNLNEILHDRAHGRLDGSNLILYSPLWGASPDSPLITGTGQSVTISGSNALSCAAPYFIKPPSGLSGAGRAVKSSIADINTAFIWALKPASAGVDIVLRGNGTVFTSASASSVTLDKPASTAATDVLVAYFAVNGSSKTITPPAGWTSVGSASNLTNGAKAEMFWALGDVASTTFTLTAGTSIIAFIGCFIGVNNGTPSDGSGSTGTNGAQQNIIFGQVNSASVRAMVTGIGVINAASGTPTFSNIWQQEVDLSGARRIGQAAGAPVIGGPPFVGKYGSFNLPAGLWAASSGGTAVTADAVFNLEFGQTVQGDGQINAEWLIPLQADRASNLEWMISLQKDQAKLLEWLITPQADAVIPLEILARPVADALTNLEYGIPLSKDQTANLEFLISLARDSIVNLEFLGVPVVNSDAVILLEFLGGLAADRNLNLEFGIPLQKDGANPLEFGQSLLRDSVTSLEFKTGLQRDSIIFLEFLGFLAKNEIPVIEWLKGLARDSSVNLEIGSSTVASDSVLPLEFKTGLFRDSQTALEFLQSNGQNQAAVLEWLKGLAADKNINIEFSGQALARDAILNLEWKAFSAEVLADKIKLLSPQIRQAGQIVKANVTPGTELGGISLGGASEAKTPEAD